MREILGRRRKLSLRRGGRPAVLTAALAYATEWQWPVLPGAGLRPAGGRGTVCACPHPDCAAPGAHPFDPGLLAATTDARMVRWWWTNRPDAPVVLATGGRGPCAVSLPAVAGARALASLDRAGVRVGPVVATPDRWALLVAPYSLEVLGELLHRQDWVPGSLRFHGEGGYVALPPSPTGAGRVRWERAPQPGGAAAGPFGAPGTAKTRRADRALLADRAGALGEGGGSNGGKGPWLPDISTVVDVLVEESAGTGTQGGGSRLAY
ncbi:bifunctional DNA primase/polymerase [Streptomyces albireticuli]|uniref:DNA primase n=1 Tax=Streptomyces albireticuli TaxID=1940 RepID=A0A2A2DAF0_9ACTN|nr:bifunctional DNA primase/polymerase [Streptomyces albireticuli]MCD9143671.1 bifunctional DNA primase/polymerase [Streptomyces albireticuli]MCD9161898.1 bifunctional DNA primase/polymerase [Streptomyces albireticuli]MCD9191788.1 bifunctional DNA primase/polymerase [Streptomyces albireticuli]PAU48451.1 DNA primase [Streptomyces albireticuli]